MLLADILYIDTVRRLVFINARAIRDLLYGLKRLYMLSYREIEYSLAAWSFILDCGTPALHMTGPALS